MSISRGAPYLQVLLTMEHNALCFDLPVLDVHFVTAQHYGNVLAHTHQVTMPVGHIFIGHSRSYIKHDDCTLSCNEAEMHMLNHCWTVKVYSVYMIKAAYPEYNIHLSSLRTSLVRLCPIRYI